ncbi:hypothetical protein DA391_14965 [Yersinia massiliensis]|uniref:Secreted protein n=1 Tax=Yersinia massiliensis TaxID=419257 RepID=A0ABM6UVN6_9GAMM|nr:hypothetical protein DA391_14965 [Yersinia massiliensis]
MVDTVDTVQGLATTLPLIVMVTSAACARGCTIISNHPASISNHPAGISNHPASGPSLFMFIDLSPVTEIPG